MRFQILTDPPKTQYRIWKDVDLRALKIDDSFITNWWKISPWMFSQQSSPNLRSHLVLPRIHNGILIVLEILKQECRWFNRYCHKHSTNHRMFFSISCNIENSFLSFPHLIILPIHALSWFYRQFQFCFFVPHDGILRSCHFLRNDIIRSPWSVGSVSPFLTDCAVPSRRISSRSGPTFLTILQEVLTGRPDRSYVVVSVFHSWEDQSRSSSNYE